MIKLLLRGIHIDSSTELSKHIYHYFDEISQNQVIYHCTYKLADINSDKAKGIYNICAGGMRVINSITENYVPLFTIINIVEFVIGVYMFCVPDRKGLQEYLICLYGGFFFGAIPLYMLFDTMTAVFIGCMFLSVIFIVVNYFWMKKVIPAGVILFKINLILGSIWFEKYYCANRLDFFFKAMLFSVIILFAIDFLSVYDLCNKKKRIFISGLFGVLELSGSIIQFYRMDYHSFSKDLFNKRESVSLILCLLKVDFWKFHYQYYFLFLIIALLIIFFVWRRILLIMIRLIENLNKNKR